MRRLPAALVLLSATLIGFQLVLMQLLSIAQWHHFAYMVISVALLGFGASGTAIALARDWFLKWFDLIVPAAMLTAGAAMPLATSVSLSDVARFDSYVLLVEPVQLGSLVLLFIPFFLGALAVGLILVRHAKEAGTYYFANLFGSGLGAIAVLALMWTLDPTRLPAAAGLVAAAAGFIIIPRRYRQWLAPVAFAAPAVCVFFLLVPPSI